MVHTPEQDIELDILEHIHSSTVEVRQRDLAHIISKSLGMTNAILKRLTEKGMLIVSKVNNRNISYAVTPDGMRELAKRSYHYVKRTIRNVVFFKDALDEHLRTYSNDGAGQKGDFLVLLGKSEIDFILEHLCSKYGFNFVRIERMEEVLQLEKAPFLMVLAEDMNLTDYQDQSRAAVCCHGVPVLTVASLFEAALP